MTDADRNEWTRRERASPGTAQGSWPAAHGAGRGVGGVLLVVELLLVAVAFWRSQSASGPFLWFLWLAILTFVVLAALTSWLLRAIRTMRYVLDDHQLTILWMGRKHVVALGEIVDVIYDPHLPTPSAGWEPIWPGLTVWTRRRRDGVWRAWATLPPRGRVRIRTTTGGVEISPDRPIRFLVDIDRRRAGATVVSEPHQPGEREPWRTPVRPRPTNVERGPEPTSRQPGLARTEGRLLRHAYHKLFRTEVLGDRLSSNLLAVGVIIPLVMIAYLFSQMEGVPDPVALHWDALAEVDRVGPPSALWQLPILAVVVLAFNTVVATALVAIDRFLSRLVLVATPIVQVIAAIALIRTVG